MTDRIPLALSGIVRLMGAPLKKQGGIFLPRHNEACHPVEKAQYLGDGASGEGKLFGALQLPLPGIGLRQRPVCPDGLYQISEHPGRN